MDVLAACPANQTPVLKPQHNINRQSDTATEHTASPQFRTTKSQHNADRNPSVFVAPAREQHERACPLDADACRFERALEWP